MSFKLQEWIHHWEEGKGVRVIKMVTFIAALIFLNYWYSAGHFKNYANPEAMDAAQLARNIAAGKGYTTQFLRPVSLWMVNKKVGDMHLEAHPDLANAPLYPFYVAGFMRGNFDWVFTNDESQAGRYHPESDIKRINFWLFLTSVGLLFFLARKLFDEPVAWVSVILFAGADLVWQFTLSGLSTMFLLTLFLLLIWCLVAAEQGAREKQWGAGRLLLIALSAGALAGACGLTRYAMLCLILPTLAFFVLCIDRMKILLALAVLAGFCSVVSPWLIRNYEISGTLFGTAGLAVYEDTLRFPGNRLERSLRPDDRDGPNDLAKVDMWEHWDKLWTNLPQIMQNDLPRLGGSWVTAFFLVGLLVPFRSPALSRLRWFALASLLLLALAQALGRTALTTAAPDVNSENLLVLLAPLIMVYGVGMYFTLLEQSGAAHPAFRNLANGLFVLLGCAPLLFRLLGGPSYWLAYPPYYPPAVQECAGWLGKNELMMSDVPWAVAWYGNRSCLWLTSDIQNDFRAVNAKKKITGLYLTQLTTNGRLLTEMSQGREREWGRVALRTLVRDDPKTKDVVWGNFAWEAVMKEEVPDGFPLGETPGRSTLVGCLFPEQIFLTDRPRWKAGR